MNQTLFIFFALFCFLSSGVYIVVADQGNKTYAGSKALERIKQLAWNWLGEENFGKGNEKVKANYPLTFANSTIIDNFHMGMPHFGLPRRNKVYIDPILRSGEATQTGFNGNLRK